MRGKEKEERRRRRKVRGRIGRRRRWRKEECEEVTGEGLRLLAEGGIVSLGLVLNVLQCLFVLFLFWRREEKKTRFSLTWIYAETRAPFFSGKAKSFISELEKCESGERPRTVESLLSFL